MQLNLLDLIRQTTSAGKDEKATASGGAKRRSATTAGEGSADPTPDLNPISSLMSSLLAGTSPAISPAGSSRPGSSSPGEPGVVKSERREPIEQTRTRIAPLKRVPLIKQIWLDVRRSWFPDRPDLDHYIVVWSRRPQKRTLASCNIESKRVIVARELNYPEHYRWLKPLLYHEMCHAYLGFSVVDEDKRCRWHGREFKSLERRYPGMPEFDYWVKSGGWDRAVRSDRSKRAHRARKEKLSQLVRWRPEQ